jgi:hypothetical protein
MNESHEVLSALASLDGPTLAKALRHLLFVGEIALANCGSRVGVGVVERFRLDDLVPLADVLSFLFDEVDLAKHRHLLDERGGAR